MPASACSYYCVGALPSVRQHLMHAGNPIEVSSSRQVPLWKRKLSRSSFLLVAWRVCCSSAWAFVLMLVVFCRTSATRESTLLLLMLVRLSRSLNRRWLKVLNLYCVLYGNLVCLSVSHGRSLKKKLIFFWAYEWVWDAESRCGCIVRLFGWSVHGMWPLVLVPTL